MQEKFIFDGEYSVTEDGKVYSHKKGVRREMKGGVTSNGKGYKVVTITNNRIAKNVYVHRLVAAAFIENPENKPQVNHIDGNTRNNNVKNLEWCTSRENTAHSYRTGLHNDSNCLLCGKRRYDAKFKICRDCKNKIALAVELSILKCEENKHATEILNGNKLTERAAKFLSMRACGMTYKEIADVCNCSRQNVHETIKNVFASN